MARPPTPPRRYPPYGLSGPLPDRITQGLEQGHFTEAARNIVAVIERNWPRAAWAPATRLAEAAACDKATLSRFIRQLGYSDHTAFQQAAQIAVSQADALVVDSDADDLTAWLMREFTSLEHDTKAHIKGFSEDDLEYYADQVQFVSGRLARAKRIYIAAGTSAAVTWCSSIADLFAAALPTPVEEIWKGGQLRPRNGNHLIILHVGDPSGASANHEASAGAAAYDYTQSKTDGVHAVHIVVGGAMLPDRCNEHRVLHAHCGPDYLAGITAMINTCTIIIRESLTRIRP